MVEREEAIALRGEAAGDAVDTAPAGVAMAAEVGEAGGRPPAPGSALQRIEAVVRAFYEHFRSHPELPRFMMQELALGQAPPAAVIDPIRRIHKALVTLVRAGQAAGEIRGDDPLVLVVSVVAQPIHFGLVGRAFATITGQDPDDPTSWEEVVRNAVTFVRAGLAAHPAEGGL
jgi:AcrR family transcriptional regulator